MLEILLVIIIIGVLAAAVAPALEGMLSGGALKTAARELAGAERYCRSMALLNQTPIDLIVNLEEGSFRVEARERESSMRLGMSDLTAITNDVGYTDELLASSARRPASLSGGFGMARSANDRAEMESSSSAAEVDGAAQSTITMADGRSIASTASLEKSINFERKCEGVHFSFDGYSDNVHSARSDEEDAAFDGKSVYIHFRANGSVRPHSFKVHEGKEGDSGGTLTISVNSVAVPRILNPGERP